MATNEIPREEWPDFFDTFSRRHEGWLITLEAFGQDIGAQVQAQQQRLRGATAELSEIDGDRITVFTGEQPEEPAAHGLISPTHVRIKQTADGADEAVQIETAGGETFLITFRAALRPEMVDGVLH